MLIRLPMSISHIRNMLSQLPLTIFVPSILIATLETLSPCPLSVLIRLPVAISHMHSLLSSLPLTIFVPLGLIATLSTLS
ncbi:membrane protein [Candidatus Magnetobacterium bavaricum]|uniref:Membrane protein n=1 Tax=Candidatus Magnetobacterium bavaricum TaxID=29290 RepID=A0A0F3GZ57_9BACT|nr:membrane protein [Candidatus Magnetobacterium bavaricum]